MFPNNRGRSNKKVPNKGIINPFRREKVFPVSTVLAVLSIRIILHPIQAIPIQFPKKREIHGATKWIKTEVYRGKVTQIDAATEAPTTSILFK